MMEVAAHNVDCPVGEQLNILQIERIETTSITHLLDMYIDSSADIDDMLVDTLTSDQMRDLGLEFINFSGVGYDIPMCVTEHICS